MLVLTLFSKLSFVIKSHFCPFLLEWNRFVLFLLLKNKQKTVFWEFLFQASQVQKKRGHLFCIFAIQRNQNPYNSSPFENFSWTQLSHMFFFQQVPIFMAVLLLTGIGLCCWTNLCGNEQGIFKNIPPFPWSWACSQFSSVTSRVWLFATPWTAACSPWWTDWNQFPLKFISCLGEGWVPQQKSRILLGRMKVVWMHNQE